MSTIDPSVSVEISEMVKKTGAELCELIRCEIEARSYCSESSEYMSVEMKACGEGYADSFLYGRKDHQDGGNGKAVSS